MHVHEGGRVEGCTYMRVDGLRDSRTPGTTGRGTRILEDVRVNGACASGRTDLVFSSTHILCSILVECLTSDIA